MSIRRAKTGFPFLDKILEGGFPRPSSVLVAGSIGTNKNTFSQQFLWEGLKQGEKAIYFTVDALPRDLIENMLKYGWDVRPYLKRKQLVFIDGFSSRIGLETDADYVLENPFDVNEVLRVLMLAESEVFAEGGGRLVLAHLSTLFFLMEKKDILRFVERIHAEARKFDGIYMMVYSEGVQDKHVETFLMQLPDVVIRMAKEWHGDKPKRVLWIDRCIKTRYPRDKFEFKLTPNGIVIVEKEPVVY